MPQILMTGLTKRYAPSAPPAVDSLDLQVEDGELLCLLGPSGCGKTTTLRMLAGLEDVTAGRIEVDGTVWDDAAAGTHVRADRRGLGLVFQSYALWPHMDVLGNVTYPLRFTTHPKSEAGSRVEQVLATLGISDYRSRYPSELSGGQQQRVALARALVARPGILLLDEPLSNLDARLRLEMRSELARIHRETSSTILLVTHDQWEAMTLATRIALMDRGRIVQLATPAELYLNPVNRFVAEFIGNPPLQTIELADDEDRFTRHLGEWAARVLPRETVSAVGLRPEMIRVRAASNGNGVGDIRIAEDSSLTLTGTVRDVVPTGGSWLAEIDLGGRILPSLSTTRPQATRGERVDVHVPESGMHAFDPTGRTLTLS